MPAKMLASVDYFAWVLISFHPSLMPNKNNISLNIKTLNKILQIYYLCIGFISSCEINGLPFGYKTTGYKGQW